MGEWSEASGVSSDVSPAMRYKEIAGLARKATVDLQAWERSRMAELEHATAAAREEIEAATDREQRMMSQAHRWWRMALDNVAKLSWVSAGLEPEPIESARASQRSRYTEDVRAGYQELTQAVLDLSWRAR
ncbi:MAG: hypothetical protein GEU97_06190 [Actinophytocola sp.]|nr:hypothetical protein [Actinophytocola sp.]